MTRSDARRAADAQMQTDPQAGTETDTATDPQPDAEPETGPGPEAPPEGAAPESAAEALARARRHGRAAAAEATAALRALLEAAALTAGSTGAAHGQLAPLAAALDGLHERLGGSGGGGDDAARVLDGVLDALDAEIARWEARSREEPEARAVVRAFLAVRELLFELGLRRARTASEAPARRGLQRVPVES